MEKDRPKSDLDGLVAVIAKGIFVIGAIIFSLVAFHPVTDIPHALRHSGVGMTIFASFMGAYDFATSQGRKVDRWLLGCNLTILITTILFCTLAISKDDRVVHNIFVHSALFLYVVWDLIAVYYYGQVSRSGLVSYRTMLRFDLLLFTIYSLAYIPVDRFVNPTVAEAMFQTHSEHALSDLIAGTILIAEFGGFLFYRPKVAPPVALGERLSVVDGYATVANYYNNGNFVMWVEQSHTRNRLSQLDIKGVVVDLGCGTGRYIEDLLQRADRIYAIDSSEEMLKELRKKYNSPKLVIDNNEADLGLEALDPDSVDGVFCSLLIDHVGRNRLQDIFVAAYRVLRPGGWFYITDINPYYEQLEHPYAEYMNPQGEGVRIIVYPHPISEIKTRFESARFSSWELREVNVLPEHAEKWDKLQALVGHPLIFEYLAIK